MKSVLLATAVLLVGTGYSFAQTASDSCGDVINDPNASCSSVMDPSAGGSVNSQAPGSSGRAIGNGLIDNQATGSILNADPTIPTQRVGPDNPAPIIVPNDPLGRNVGRDNPYGGGNQIGIPQQRSLGTNGVSIPTTR